MITCVAPVLADDPIPPQNSSKVLQCPFSGVSRLPSSLSRTSDQMGCWRVQKLVAVTDDQRATSLNDNIAITVKLFIVYA